METATGPNPGPALLVDLFVMATLNRMVWEAYWRPQVFGNPAAVHDVNTDVQTTFKQADMTLKSSQQTTVAASDLVASTDALLARLAPDGAAEPVTMRDCAKGIETFQKAVSDGNPLVLTVDQAGMPLISTVMEPFSRSAEDVSIMFSGGYLS